jgi:hypothetical protein
LELIIEGSLLTTAQIQPLLIEAGEIVAITAASKKTASATRNFHAYSAANRFPATSATLVVTTAPGRSMAAASESGGCGGATVTWSSQAVFWPTETLPSLDEGVPIPSDIADWTPEGIGQ